MKAIHAIESADDGTDSLGESVEDKSDTDDEPAANSHIAESCPGEERVANETDQISSMRNGLDLDNPAKSQGKKIGRSSTYARIGRWKKH